MVAQWDWKGNSAHLDIQTPQIKGLKTRDHLFLRDTKTHSQNSCTVTWNKSLQVAGFNAKYEQEGAQNISDPHIPYSIKSPFSSHQ